MDMTFYPVCSDLLKDYIAHFWVAAGESGIEERLLLPMDHADMIIPVGGRFEYEGQSYESIHFHGLRENPVAVKSVENTFTIGVSFFPWGAYPVIRKSMSSFTGKIVRLADEGDEIDRELDNVIKNAGMNLEKVLRDIEAVFEKYFCLSDKNAEDLGIIHDFIISGADNIRVYTESVGISIRRLERLCDKYIGVSPRKYRNIERFEDSVRDVLAGQDRSLTETSLNNGFYDQAHFNRKFKGYSGYSPGQFKRDVPAQKQHFNYKRK